MKIIRNDKVYVQKNDLALLNRSDESIPAIVYYKMFEGGMMIVGDFNRDEFVEYNAAGAIDFFKNATWILDYDEVKDLTEEELDSLGEEIIDQRNSIATMYNGMTQEERAKNQALPTQCKFLEYKLMMLRDFELFKRGKKELTLPIGIEYPQRQKRGIKQKVKSLLDKFKK